MKKVRRFNEKALFTEDYYYKYGIRPTPAEVSEKYNADIPFSPVQRRYTGYQKSARGLYSSTI